MNIPINALFAELQTYFVFWNFLSKGYGRYSLQKCFWAVRIVLTHFKVMFTLYRNHSIDGRFKSVDCFLCDGEMRLFVLLTET